ncbi:hypothetical protein KSP39_PZI010623 [Platanthera zijinensis]|uniref:Uncharacterized protein n=1 Tax=Platanthera zijinensis TaxID=2320716 RepID=A0AAP0BIN0_9ASPA
MKKEGKDHPSYFILSIVESHWSLFLEYFSLIFSCFNVLTISFIVLQTSGQLLGMLRPESDLGLNTKVVALGNTFPTHGYTPSSDLCSFGNPPSKLLSSRFPA